MLLATIPLDDSNHNRQETVMRLEIQVKINETLYTILSVKIRGKCVISTFTVSGGHSSSKT